MKPVVSPRHLRKFFTRHLRLASYLEAPGDRRQWAGIAAKTMLWGLLLGFLLRERSFVSIEALARSRARRGLGLEERFSNDALGYFTERLDPSPTRQSLIGLARQAKRSKCFGPWIGLAVDGTTAGHSATARCPLCRPIDENGSAGAGYHHCWSAVSVVGAGLTLPLDIEPYGPGDSEYTASQRLLERVLPQLGPRFADYVVGDGAYATAPFLHVVTKLGLRAVARLKGNLPELQAAVEQRFASLPAQKSFHSGRDWIELWDAADFDPWQSLRWKTVRVLRYRQHKPDGSVVQADWLTNFSPARVGSEQLYAMAKSRWEIENQLFNEAKNLYGMTHIRHHHANSLLVCWLLLLLALCAERLYRLRYLHRGGRPPYDAIELLRLLRLALAQSATAIDTS